MAQSYYPFDSQATTETQYSQLFRELQDTGVAASADSNALKASADGTVRSVSVQPGFAIVRGHAYSSTAVEVLAIAAASGAADRYDRVVLRLDPTLNSIVLAVVDGTPGAGIPAALTQTDTGIYELPVAVVRVPQSATVIQAANVTDERPFTGVYVGSWTTATRPASPRKARLGLNSTTGSWEFWDGAAWAGLIPSTTTWASLTGIPATFAPSAHVHDWSALTGKPATFPPSGHTQDWSTITGTPSTYPPATHSHFKVQTGTITVTVANGAVSGVAALNYSGAGFTGNPNVQLTPQIDSVGWQLNALNAAAFSSGVSTTGCSVYVVLPAAAAQQYSFVVHYSAIQYV